MSKDPYDQSYEQRRLMPDSSNSELSFTDWWKLWSIPLPYQEMAGMGSGTCKVCLLQSSIAAVYRLTFTLPIGCIQGSDGNAVLVPMVSGRVHLHGIEDRVTI